MARWATVLAGGSGTRFWPLSTPKHPKQFLPLAGNTPLLEQTVARLTGVVPMDRIVIVTAERYADRTRELLSQLPPENVLAEPRAASTGPALTWASHFVRHHDPRASMISVHADWQVVGEDAFRRDAALALSVAEEQDVLVTIGVVPTRPEEGYGYIVPGANLSGAAKRVERFVEKPPHNEAVSLIEQGGLWNCGLFAWTVDRFFRETDVLAKEIAPAIHHLDDGRVRSFFESVEAIAIDKSHFERSRHVVVLPASFKWDDVGNWAALTRVRGRDTNGNVIVGPVQSRDSRDCIVWSPNDRIALYGVEGLVVARANGITMVTTREGADRLKEFVENLPQDWRDP